MQTTIRGLRRDAPAALRVLAWLSLACFGSADAAPFRLVKDVYPGASSGADSYMLSDGSKLFFWGYDGISGSAGQPWISDGTTAGTLKVGDVVGSGGAFLGNQPRFAHEGVVYFVFYDGFVGNQLWRSDGTMPGTFALTSAPGGVDTNPLWLTPIGGVLLFEDGNGISGYTLTSTDGTVAGTHALTSAFVTVSAGAIQQGRAIFLGNSLGGPVLITSDGTAAGTSSFSVPALTAFSPAKSIVAVNEIAYFAASDSTHGMELWKTDGTAAGTAMVRDIYVGGSSYPDQLTRVDDRLFFTATTPGSGLELWRSDGTLSGTVLAKDVHAGLIGSAPAQLTPLDGTLYFVANDGPTGSELWKSDGSDAGTQLALGDFIPGVNGAFAYGYNTVQAVNHGLALVMLTPGSSYNVMPYASDGTLAGTHLMDASQNVLVLYSGLVAANGQLFASGSIQPSSYGNELIATDAFAALGNTWCASVEQAIPDDAPAGGVSSRFRLPEHGAIGTLGVSLDIGHGSVGDLRVTLRHQQTGTEVILLDRPHDSANAAQYCPGDLLDVVFDDSAAATVQGTCVDARLAYPRNVHLQPANALGAFAGEALAGDWALTATDNSAGSTGILHEWCLSFTPANVPPSATNLSAPEVYVEDTSLDLVDIVASDTDSASVTAVLTLSSPGAGSLTTATAGAVTSSYVPATGVWTAAGAIADVNALLAGVHFVPAANVYAGLSIATSVSDGSGSVTGIKTLTGTPVNDAPTLDAIADPAPIAMGAGVQTVLLAGIGPGAGDPLQTLAITAISSNPALIPDPTVHYTSPSTTGSLTFTPAASQQGSASITVTISDDGGTANGGANQLVRGFTQQVLGDAIFGNGFE